MFGKRRNFRFAKISPTAGSLLTPASRARNFRSFVSMTELAFPELASLVDNALGVPGALVACALDRSRIAPAPWPTS